MPNHFLKCEVGKGTFSTERSILIRAGEHQYGSVVDQSDVKVSETLGPGKRVSGQVRVQVVARDGDTWLVDLPRDTFSTGRRIRVPKTLIVQE